MNIIEKLTHELAEECRKAGTNFIIVIEDKGIHSQSRINGKTPLRKLNEVLKEICKK